MPRDPGVRTTLTIDKVDVEERLRQSSSVDGQRGAAALSSQVFPIRVDPRARLLLLLFGVRPGNAWVRLERDRIVARFGFSRAEIPFDAVDRWEITGPYRWWRALGIRGTIGQPELTYGGATHGGLCFHLRRSVRISGVRVRRFYVTADDLEGLASALTSRGIPGEDRRALRGTGG